MDEFSLPQRIVNNKDLEKCWLAGVYPTRFQELVRRDTIENVNVAELW